MKRAIAVALVVVCGCKKPGGSGGTGSGTGTGTGTGSNPRPVDPPPCTQGSVPFGGTISGESHVSWETHEATSALGTPMPLTTWKYHYTWHELTDLESSPSCDHDTPLPEGDSGQWSCTWHTTFHPEDEGDYYYVTEDYTSEQWNHLGQGTTTSESIHRTFFHVGGGGKETCPVVIVGDAVDQDDPKRTEYTDLASPGLVYGGELRATSDKLRVRALTLGTVEAYTWSVTGPDAARYPPPGSTDVWDLGAIAAKPGKLHFHVDVRFTEGGSASADYDVEVGVRTDDVVVIGWIDPRGVTLPTSGVAADVQRLLPPSGVGFGDPAGSVAWLGSVAEGALGDNLTEADRRYVLNWMFEYASNGPPPRSFASEEALAAFAAVPEQYKLFNRFQVKYRTGGMPVFSEAPTVLHQTAHDGTTIDPIMHVPFPGVPNPFVDDLVTRAPASIDHINEGSPDAQGVKLFNRLMAPKHVTWNDIGSRIGFRVADGGRPKIDMQLYPTYYIYWNADGGGWALQEQFPQAPEPADNFTNPSFPPSHSLDLLFRRSDR